MIKKSYLSLYCCFPWVRFSVYYRLVYFHLAYSCFKFSFNDLERSLKFEKHSFGIEGV